MTPRPRPPLGVRVVLAGGEEIPCTCHRDPGRDADGCAAWVAVPLREIRAARVRAVRADTLPARTALHLALEEAT